MTHAERGPFAPYPVWMTMTVIVRLSQLLFVACCVWFLAALFDAMDRSRTILIPPAWLWGPAIFLGTGNGIGGWRWKLSPAGDAIATRLAPHHCPDCGQDIFDPSPPTGYASNADRRSWLPQRSCANCGEPLTRKASA